MSVNECESLVWQTLYFEFVFFGVADPDEVDPDPTFKDPDPADKNKNRFRPNFDLLYIFI